MHQVSTTKMSSKGQVVIPQDIRKQFGFKTGMHFMVSAKHNELFLKVISERKIPVEGVSPNEMIQFAGIFTSKESKAMQECVNEACERIDSGEWSLSA